MRIMCMVTIYDVIEFTIRANIYSDTSVCFLCLYSVMASKQPPMTREYTHHAHAARVANPRDVEINNSA